MAKITFFFVIQIRQQQKDYKVNNTEVNIN